MFKLFIQEVVQNCLNDNDTWGIPGSCSMLGLKTVFEYIGYEIRAEEEVDYIDIYMYGIVCGILWFWPQFEAMKW